MVPLCTDVDNNADCRNAVQSAKAVEVRFVVSTFPFCAVANLYRHHYLATWTWTWNRNRNRSRDRYRSGTGAGTAGTVWWSNK